MAEVELKPLVNEEYYDAEINSLLSLIYIRVNGRIYIADLVDQMNDIELDKALKDYRVKTGVNRDGKKDIIKKLIRGAEISVSRSTSRITWFAILLFIQLVLFGVFVLFTLYFY
jgi:hypothetical protein